jgi:tetratricopeptide (TPR) repeat protein
VTKQDRSHRAPRISPALCLLLFFLAAACCVVQTPARAQTDTEKTDAKISQIKLYCKNKCQYDYRENCYETCIKERGEQQGVAQIEEVTFEQLVDQAREFFEQKDFVQAANVYQEILKIDPLAAIAHYNLGICYEMTGQNALAIESYTQYLFLKPFSDDRPEVEAWIRRLKMHPEEEQMRYQTFTIASSPAGKVKLRIIQQTDVRLRVDIIAPEPFQYKIVERVDPPSVSLRAYLPGYTPTREVIPVWRGGIKEILLHWEQDQDDPAKRSYVLVTIRLHKEPKSSEPFSGFSDGYASYDALDNQIYTFDMADDERRFSFVFDIHLTRESSFVQSVNIQQVPVKDLCEVISRYSGRGCVIDYRLYREWENQDRAINYSADEKFVENLLDLFANQLHFRWVETDAFYVLLSEQGFEWLAQNSAFYYLRPDQKPDMSAYVLDPVSFDPVKVWDVMNYFNNWHYLSFKESVVWRIKDAAKGGEGVRTAGVLNGGPTLEEFLTAYCVANSLFWFRIWDAYFITDRIDRQGTFVELAQLGDWVEKIPDDQPPRLGFNELDIPQKARYYARWGLIFMNNKQGAWALREFEKAIDRAPESADIYYFAGVATLIDGKRDLAIRAFQRAIRLRPEFVMAHYMLARTYETYDDLRGAVEHYKTALTFQPDFEPAARDLGILYTRKGLIKDAIEHYQRAVLTMPADMEAQYEFSRALYFDGQYEPSWNHLVVARPTEYVAMTFPQIQRRLIMEFGQQWHKDWYKYESGWYYKYPKHYQDIPGWYYNRPDWRGFTPGYQRDDSRWYRAFPDQNYYPYYDEDFLRDGFSPDMDTGRRPAGN